MSIPERAEAERELTRLLNRALQSIPFVRLDKVDEVISKFQAACQLLEENLQGDIDLSVENDSTDESILHIPRSVPTAQKRGDSDEEEEDEKYETEEQKKDPVIIRPITKSSERDAIRKDFSSPDIKTRGLLKNVPSVVPTGGAANDSGRTQPSSRSGGMSSRARQGLQQNQGQETTSSGPRLGLTGFKPTKPGAGGLREQVLAKGSQQREDVAISKERYTKDDGTPRLGGRKLPAGRSHSMADLRLGPSNDTSDIGKQNEEESEPKPNVKSALANLQEFSEKAQEKQEKQEKTRESFIDKFK